MFVPREPRALEELVAVARLHGWGYVGQRDRSRWLRLLLFEAGIPGLTVVYHE